MDEFTQALTQNFIPSLSNFKTELWNISYYKLTNIPDIGNNFSAFLLFRTKAN